MEQSADLCQLLDARMSQPPTRGHCTARPRDTCHLSVKGTTLIHERGHLQQALRFGFVDQGCNIERRVFETLSHPPQGTAPDLPEAPTPE